MVALISLSLINWDLELCVDGWMDGPNQVCHQDDEVPAVHDGTAVWPHLFRLRGINGEILLWDLQVRGQ